MDRREFMTLGAAGALAAGAGIQEALSMQKPYDEKLHHIAEQIAY